MKFELPTGGAVFIPESTTARKEKIDKLYKELGAALRKTEVRALAITWYSMDALLWCFQVTGHKDIAATLAKEFESLPWQPDTRSDEQLDADAKAIQDVFDNVLGLKKAWDNNGSDQYDADAIEIGLIVLGNVIHKLVGGLFGGEAAVRFKELLNTAADKTVQKVLSALPAEGGLN